MIDAQEFMKRKDGRRFQKKQAVNVEITLDRYEWIKKLSQRTGKTLVEVIEAGIDALREIEQEVAQTE